MAVGYYIIWGILTLLAISTGATLFYYIWSIFMLTFFFMQLILHQNCKNVTILCYVTQQILTSGDKTNVEYKVTNTGFLPIGHAKITFDLDAHIETHTSLREIANFKSYEMINFSKEIKFPYRGFYSIGYMTMVVYDPLRLFHKEMIFQKGLNLIVYPKIYDLQKYSDSLKRETGKRRTSKLTHENRVQLSHTKDYAHGDLMKDIHWKLSSRMNTLQTKIYEDTEQTSWTILLAGSPNYTKMGMTLLREEQLISYLASIIKTSLVEQNTVTLYSHSHNLEGNGLSDWQVFLDELTQYRFDSALSFEQLIRQWQYSEPTVKEILCVIPYLSDEVVNLIDQYTQSGYAVVIMTLSEDEYFLKGNQLIKFIHIPNMN